MAGRDTRAAWKLGIASGLVAIAALWVRRVKREATPDELSARLVNDGSERGTFKSRKDEPAKRAAEPPAEAKRAESLGRANARARLSARETGANATATLPIRPAGAKKATQLAVAVCLGLLTLSAAYNAVQLYRINRSTDLLLAAPPQSASVDAAESTELEQRAWIGISLPQTHPLTSDGGGFGVELRNFGKTPAVQTLVTDYVVIEGLDELTGAQEASSYRPLPVGTLMPGSAFATDVRFKTSAEGVHSLSTGKVRVVNYALVTYEDVFHRKHTTRACFYWHGGLLAPLPCENFNTAD